MEHYDREYGTGTTVLFELWEPDGTDFITTASFAAGDIVVIKDEAAGANATNTPTHEGGGVYSLALTATEMQAARVAVYIVDQTATKVWLDKALVVETYGNASAQHTQETIDVGSDSRVLVSADAHSSGQTITAISGTKGTLDDLNDVSAADVNAQCDTALTDYDAVVPADLPTNFADLAITATTGQVTVGTNNDKTGYSISGTKTTLDDLNDITAAAVWGVATRTLTANTNLNDPTAAAIADAIWDELQADHVGAGSFGEIATEIASILADTNEVQGDLANGGRIDALIDAIKAKTDSLTFTTAGEVDANVQSINDTTITGDGSVGNEFGV